jgi:hypothetical protein
MRLLVVACFAALAAAALPSLVAADGPPQGVAQDGIGIVSPDGKTRYVTWTSGSNVVLEAVTTRGGMIVNERVLHGPFAIPAIAYTPTGITPDGRTLVLTTWPWHSGPATFLVLSAPDFTTRATVTLRGSWSYDAISPHGRTLFLIQSLNRGQQYRVRAYDLLRNRLLKRVVADRRERGPMAGFPVGRAESRDGRWIFTLYDRANGTAFVHVLDAVRGTAVCVDLRGKGWNDPWNTRVWLSRDGSVLHLRQLTGAPLRADIDTQAWRARAT